MYKVGDRVGAMNMGNMEAPFFTGDIIEIFPANVAPKASKIRLYYGSSAPTHAYKAVGVERVVIKKDGGKGCVIIPVGSKSNWDVRVMRKG